MVLRRYVGTAALLLCLLLLAVIYNHFEECSRTCQTNFARRQRYVGCQHFKLLKHFELSVVILSTGSGYGQCTYNCTRLNGLYHPQACFLPR